MLFSQEGKNYYSVVFAIRICIAQFAYTFNVWCLLTLLKTSKSSYEIQLNSLKIFARLIWNEEMVKLISILYLMWSYGVYLYDEHKCHIKMVWVRLVCFKFACTIQFLRAYRNTGIGYDWALHAILNVCPSLTRATLYSSSKLTFGETLPTGSINRFNDFVSKMCTKCKYFVVWFSPAIVKFWIRNSEWQRIVRKMEIINSTNRSNACENQPSKQLKDEYKYCDVWSYSIYDDNKNRTYIL